MGQRTRRRGKPRKAPPHGGIPRLDAPLASSGGLAAHCPAEKGPTVGDPAVGNSAGGNAAGDGLTADGLKHVDMVQQAFADRLAQQTREAFRSLLEQGAPMGHVHEHVGRVLSSHGDMLQELHPDPPMACRRGCVHCCFNHVSLSEPEALYLGLFLHERFSEEELRQLDERVARALELIAGKSRREIGDVRHLVPCPLLHGGTCMAHEARPLVCRGWNSVNAGQCRRSVEEGDPMLLIENHPMPRALAEALQLGLLLASRDTGREAGFLVLARALRLMRLRPVTACASDWLAGQAFFALCQEG